MVNERIEVLADGGDILYRPHWLPPLEANELFEDLLEAVRWEQRELKMFGKMIAEPRLSAWIGDPDATYKYSGREHKPVEWPASLEGLRKRLENELGQGFNSVLANLYRGERDSMGWHADNERELGKCPTIASVSLGAQRRFWLKHDSAESVRLTLDHGSLLVMRGTTQHHWKHCVPKETRPTEPRINLTFRRIHTAASFFT